MDEEPEPVSVNTDGVANSGIPGKCSYIIYSALSRVWEPVL